MCTELVALCMKMWDMHSAEGCTKKRLLPHTVNATCVCWYGCRSCYSHTVRVSIAPLAPILPETFIINILRKRLRNAEELVKRKRPLTLKILNHLSGFRPTERPAEADHTNPLVWWRVLQFEANSAKSLCMPAPLLLVLLSMLLPTPRVSPVPRLLHF